MTQLRKYVMYHYFQMRAMHHFIQKIHRSGPLLTVSALAVSAYFGLGIANQIASWLIKQYQDSGWLSFCGLIKHALDGIFFFMAFVTLIGVVEVLFRGSQMAEKEHLRLYPLNNGLLFVMKISDISFSLMLFFLPFVMLPFFIAGNEINLNSVTLIIFNLSLICSLFEVIFFMFSVSLLAVFVFPRQFWRSFPGVVLGVGILFMLLLNVTRFVHSFGGSGISLLDVAWFPTEISKSILMSHYSNDAYGVWLYLTYALLELFFLGFLCAFLYDSLFIRRAELMQAKVRGTRYPRLSLFGEWRYPTDLRRNWLKEVVALATKEFSSLIRDPSLKIAYVAGLLLSVFPFLPLLFVSGPVKNYADEIFTSIILFFSLFFVLFLCLSSVGREGECIKSLSLFPVFGWRIMLGKAIPYFIITWLLSFIFGLWLAYKLHLLHQWLWIVTVAGLGIVSAVVTATLVGVTLGLSCIYPRFHANNQFRAVSLWAIGIFSTLFALHLVSLGVSIWVVRSFGLQAIYFPFLIISLWGITVCAFLKKGHYELQNHLRGD